MFYLFMAVFDLITEEVEEMKIVILPILRCRPYVIAVRHNNMIV